MSKNVLKNTLLAIDYKLQMYIADFTISQHLIMSN
jgi:hypothetical protein